MVAPRASGPMELQPTPDALTCANCGDAITGAAYLPATEDGGVYRPSTEDAVCDACGFNDVGMMGCAPELADVTDAGPDDVLLYVKVTDDGIDVVSVKE